MENKEIFIIVGAVFVMMFLTNQGYINLPTFAIADSDFVSDGQTTIPGTIDNGTLTVMINNVTYSWPSGKIYYTVDSSTTISDTIPELTGTHRIDKFQVLTEDNLTIISKQWHTTYTKEVETVYQNVTGPTVYVAQNVTSEQICKAVNGTYSNLTCICSNGNKWYDNSTSKVCGAVTLTVTKEVEKEQTFWEKYWISILEGLILGSIIIYLMNWRKR